jgi:Tfp pilus assembly protein PilV
MKRQRKISRHPAGFTLIEAMISIIILSFGVLSLAAIYAQGIMYASLTQYDYIAEKKAEEAVETIFTARDTKVLTWAQIQNVSTGGVFIDGARPRWAGRHRG